MKLVIYAVVFALDKLAHGGDPGYAVIADAVSALEALQEDPSSLEPVQLELIEAARCLLDLANECELPLDANSRARAAQFADSLLQLTNDADFADV